MCPAYPYHWWGEWAWVLRGCLVVQGGVSNLPCQQVSNQPIPSSLLSSPLPPAPATDKGVWAWVKIQIKCPHIPNLLLFRKPQSFSSRQCNPTSLVLCIIIILIFTMFNILMFRQPQQKRLVTPGLGKGALSIPHYVLT